MLIKLRFILCTVGKFIQHFELIVTDRELISKELIGEYGWTYSVSVLPKRQLKNVPVFLSKLKFIGLSITSLKEKKSDIFTLQFHVQS